MKLVELLRQVHKDSMDRTEKKLAQSWEELQADMEEVCMFSFFLFFVYAVGVCCGCMLCMLCVSVVAVCTAHSTMYTSINHVYIPHMHVRTFFNHVYNLSVPPPP